MNPKKSATNILRFPDSQPVEAQFSVEDEYALENAIDDCGLAIDIDEIDAFIRNALYLDVPARSGFDHIVEGKTYDPSEEAVARQLQRLGYAYADYRASTYRRSAENPAYAEIRSELVDVYASFLFWMRQLEAHLKRPEDIQTKEFAELSGMVAGVCATLRFINSVITEKPTEQDKADLAALKKDVPILKSQLSILMETVEQYVKSQPASKPRRASARKTRKKRPASLKRYTIEVKLADIEPPISRMLVVPGNRTLAELHTILQHAFGWSDTHLHVFIFRKEQYGVPSPDDFDVLHDENMFTLDELRLRGRSYMEYIYDFGDDWRHELLVKSTSPNQPGDPDVPVCLAASRARPPEDCGGVPGYEDGLALMAGKHPDLAGFDESFFSWTSNYDPKHCDLDAINKALARD